MKCKYCQAEMEEDVTVCPACGKEQETEAVAEVETVEEVVTEVVSVEETPAAEETPAVQEPAAEIKEGIKATPGKIALAIVAGVVVLALLVAMVIGGIDGDLFKGAEENVAPTEDLVQTVTEATIPEGTIPPDGNPNDVTCKGSYTAADDDLYASMDTVVAKLGDDELTVGQLQVYYWESIYGFTGEWGSYASQLGLNVAGNMDRQLCAVGDISMTWQQYFLDYALNTWHTHRAMALYAEEAGYELEEIYQTELDNMSVQIEEQVSYYGLADAEEWVRGYIGPGCTVADYMGYVETYYRGYGYLENLGQSLSFTADEVEAYFAENEELYAPNGITKEAGKYYDVRHILVDVKSADESGEGTYTDADWAACEAEAQQILDSWKAGEATEDSFAALAMEKSTDPGSNYNGGLYEYLTVDTNFVPTFKEWYLDESRQVGDTGLVKSDYGYHIMYFSGSEDIWYATAESDLISETVNAKLPEAKEKYPITIDYSAIKLGAMPQGE